MIAYGSIPEKITYVCADEIEVQSGSSWDFDWHDKTKNNKIKVIPIFPIDSKASKKAAIAWATRPSYDHATGKTIQGNHSLVEIENKKFSNIKILSLDIRSQGSRAYKILIDNKYYADLREDVLVDVMLNESINKGIIQGEFLWAKLSSQTRLIRVGSELHKLIMEYETRSKLKPLKKGELEVGGIYQNKHKDKAIFIGYINSIKFKPSKNFFDYSNVRVKKAMLFCYVYEKNFDFDGNSYNIDTNENHYFRILTNNPYIEKIGQQQIPADTIVNIKKAKLSKMKQKIIKHLEEEKSLYYNKDYYLNYSIVEESLFLNMVPFDQIATPFDVKKYLILS